VKPYWQSSDGRLVIYHGDAREVAPALPFDGLVLTDPPYGIAHPTNYAGRGRERLAPCQDYLPVYDDVAAADRLGAHSLGCELLRAHATACKRLAGLGQGAARHTRSGYV
jgi:hypothetical protein